MGWPLSNFIILVSFVLPSGAIKTSNLANIYLCTANNRNTRKRCEICSELTIKTPERHVFIVNFEHISHLFLVLLLVDFEQVNVSWERCK